MTQDGTQSPIGTSSGSHVVNETDLKICLNTPPASTGEEPTIQATSARHLDTIAALRTIGIEAVYIEAEALREAKMIAKDPPEPRPSREGLTGAKGHLTKIYERSLRKGVLQSCSVYDNPPATVPARYFSALVVPLKGHAPGMN